MLALPFPFQDVATSSFERWTKVAFVEPNVEDEMSDGCQAMFSPGCGLRNMFLCFCGSCLRRGGGLRGAVFRLQGVVAICCFC